MQLTNWHGWKVVRRRLRLPNFSGGRYFAGMLDMLWFNSVDRMAGAIIALSHWWQVGKWGETRVVELRVGRDRASHYAEVNPFCTKRMCSLKSVRAQTVRISNSAALCALADVRALRRCEFQIHYWVCKFQIQRLFVH